MNSFSNGRKLRRVQESQKSQETQEYGSCGPARTALKDKKA